MSDPYRINPETGVHEKELFGILGSSWNYADEIPTRTNVETGEIETLSIGFLGESWNSTGERVNTKTGEIETLSFGAIGSHWNSSGERIDPESGEIQTESHGFLGSSWNSKYDSPTRINTENGEYETLKFGALGSSWNGGSGETYHREFDSDSNSSYGGGSTSFWSDSDEDEDEDFFGDDDSDDYDEDGNYAETSPYYEAETDEDEDEDDEDSLSDESDDEDSDEYENEFSFSSDEIPNVEHLIAMTQGYIKNFELHLEMFNHSLIDKNQCLDSLNKTNELLKKIKQDSLCVNVNDYIRLLNHPKYEITMVLNSKYNSYAESDILNHQSLLLFKRVLEGRINCLKLCLNEVLNVDSDDYLFKKKETTYEQLKIDEGFEFQHYTDYCNKQVEVLNSDYFKPFDFINQTNVEDVETCKLILQNILAIAQEYDQFKLLDTAKYFKSVYDLLTLFSFYPDYCDQFESIEKFFDSLGDTDAFEIEQNQVEYLDCNISHPNTHNLCYLIERNLKIIYENSNSFIDSMS